MTDFDPYYKWLAIPPDEQPPNHYRLLGVPLFTPDADVIDNAADQRMSHLRSYQSGKHSAESQRLLNEVSQARSCLLVPERRAEYDAALKKKLQPAPQPAAPKPAQQPAHSQQQPAYSQQKPLPQSVVRPASPQYVAPAQPQYVPQPQHAPAQRPLPLPSRTPIPVQQPVEQPEVAPTFAVSGSRSHKSAGGADATKHIAASIVGLLIGYFIICWILPTYDVLGLFHSRPKEQLEITQENDPIKPKPIDPAPVPPKPIPNPQPPVVRPAETKKIEIKPAETKITEPKNTEPKKTETKVPDPIPTPPIVSEEDKQLARVTKLKEDRAAALAKNELSSVLLMTDELAKLEAADALVERARMIDELRKAERSPAEVILLATHLIDLATTAAKAERHDFAAEQATAALLLARKSGDQELVRKATKLVLEVQEKK